MWRSPSATSPATRISAGSSCEGGRRVRPAPETLARSGLLVGSAAAASRVLGFLRDLLVASVLGAGPAADALFVALRLPNLARRILSEGALNGAILPVEG